MKRMIKHLSLLLFLVLAGCQSSPPTGVNVIFFSNISPIHESSIEKTLLEKTKQRFDIHVQLYPLSREKFSVVLSQRTGDIYIADNTYISGLLGKEGLTALDSMLPDQLDQEDSVTSFMAENEKTGERHLYGIPLKEDISIFNENEIEGNDQLVAILPSFSRYQEESMEVMKLFLNSKE
ncbi:hypothetical protein ACIQD3_02430 [Peribacillus loiseleuriae]|uniref:hypothetical protein n=1 Tax=Peribacillus loiseleuriae TaxID=1679170 RepID=UPI0038054B24